MLLVPLFFFFNDTATTEIYTLSLHDALPISDLGANQGLDGLLVLRDPRGDESYLTVRAMPGTAQLAGDAGLARDFSSDRKSTRLNSSHANISYAVFCLKKKKTIASNTEPTRA